MCNKLGTEVVSEILFSAEEIQARVQELGQQISEDYAGQELWLISILKGGAFFLVDLARAITVPVAFDFFGISSYAERRQSGAVRITKDLDQGIDGRHVLLVEDIVDTGLTLNYIRRNLQAREPASLRICVLLDRPYQRIVDLQVDYRGFEMPDVFAVGYGLDWDQKYRNLPYIGALKPELYDRRNAPMPWEA